jgi:hypothetical protein
MRLVTCPETAHLEGIECEVDANGDLLRVVRCSRFDPPEAVTCDGACAARLRCRQIRMHASAGER